LSGSLAQRIPLPQPRLRQEEPWEVRVEPRRCHDFKLGVIPRESLPFL